jgi:hypothetical protein
MIEVTVQFEVDDRPTTPSEIDDEYLAEMLDHTGEQVRQHVQARLGMMHCPEHGGAPKVTVTAQYQTDSEQMELSYHVDACCSRLLMMAVGALNH